MREFPVGWMVFPQPRTADLKLIIAGNMGKCSMLRRRASIGAHWDGVLLVTRAQLPMDARRVYSSAVDRDMGLIYDQRVMLNGHYSSKKCHEHLRRIRFKDPESGKSRVFRTKKTALHALTICALSKNRWQMELLFK